MPKGSCEYSLAKISEFADNNNLELTTESLFSIKLHKFVDVLDGKIMYINNLLVIHRPTEIIINDNMIPLVDQSIISNDKELVMLALSSKFWVCEVEYSDTIYLAVLGKTVELCNIFSKIITFLHIRTNNYNLYTFDNSTHNYIGSGNYKNIDVGDLIIQSSKDIANDIITCLPDMDLRPGINYFIKDDHNQSNNKYNIIKSVSSYFDGSPVFYVNLQGMAIGDVLKALCPNSNARIYSKYSFMVIDNIEKFIETNYNNYLTINTIISGLYDNSNIIRFFNLGGNNSAQVCDNINNMLLTTAYKVYELEFVNKGIIEEYISKIFPKEDKVPTLVSLMAKDNLPISSIQHYVNRYSTSINHIQDCIDNYSNFRKEKRITNKHFSTLYN